MRAGRLRHPIVIQVPTITRDAAGAEVTTWTELARCWAGIEPLSGRELIQAGAEQAEADVRIVLRYTTGITPRCRVVKEATASEAERVFQIIGPPINRNERGAELELRCVEQGTR